MSNIPQTMKAWVATRGGGSPREILKLEPAWPSPGPPGAGEITVKISHAALNPGDLKMMAMKMPFRGRFIPAMDFIGQIVQAGPGVPPISTTNCAIDGVIPEEGIAVAGTLPMSMGTWGGIGVLAEYVVVPAHAVGHVPEGLVRNADSAGGPAPGPAGAGLLGVAGQTSATLLRAAGLREGQRALVNGASGGVGSVLVQVLSAMGVRVTGICSGRNEALVRRLGADQVVDYTQHREALCDHLSSMTSRGSSEDQFDAIFDLVGNSTLYHRSPGCLKAGGKYLDVEAGPFGFLKVERWRPVILGGTPRAFIPVFSYPSGASAREVAGWVDRGWVREVVTDSAYEFGDAVQAYEKLASGRAAGKIYVRVS